jgi:hypothetical protein
MTFEEAEEIVDLYESREDFSCTCFQGHAPCWRCENIPSCESYEAAIKKLEEENF